MGKAKRQYQNNYVSVTQALDILRKIGLEMWFKMNTLQFINEESSKGKLIGIQIHEAIQSYIETGSAKIDTQHHIEVTNALKSFILFKNENPKIVLHKSELQCTSEIYKFNGTIDCTGRNEEEDIIFDWKTATCKDKEKPDIYDEYKFQVAAYVKLYNEINNANINKAIIVSIAKDKVAYNTYTMNKEEIENCFNEVFLPCLKIANYKRRK